MLSHERRVPYDTIANSYLKYESLVTVLLSETRRFRELRQRMTDTQTHMPKFRQSEKISPSIDAFTRLKSTANKQMTISSHLSRISWRRLLIELESLTVSILRSHMMIS